MAAPRPDEAEGQQSGLEPGSNVHGPGHAARAAVGGDLQFEDMGAGNQVGGQQAENVRPSRRRGKISVVQVEIVDDQAEGVTGDAIAVGAEMQP